MQHVEATGITSDIFFGRQLPNKTFRYEGCVNSVHFCIDSKVQKTKAEVFDFLDACSIDYLRSNARGIIELDSI
jgi:hypothetical protein